MIFLGYDHNSKAYRCYKVVVRRDVRFGTPISSNEVSIDLKPTRRVDHVEVDQPENASVQEDPSNSPDVVESDHEYVSAEEESVSVETSEPKRISQRVNKGVLPKRLIDEMHMIREFNEPKNYNEAIQSNEREKWLAAMQDEIESHEHNGTWTLVDLPAGKTAIGSKWVFKVKTGADGEFKRYKARFVAQGFSQKYGEDYDEVFTPVVLHMTFRTLLSVAASRKMLVHHFDAKTAFLNGKLDETIYMKQPRGFEADNLKVCLLKKCIYGLKQAARSWNTVLHKVLTEAGFKQSYNDPCLYSKKIDGTLCYINIYVDDLIVVCQTVRQMKEIESIFKPHFEMQDLGVINHYLGMEVSKDNHGNFELNQSAYIMRIASDFGLRDAKPAKTPMEVSYRKSISNEALDRNTKYRQLIGRLLYLSVNTRPDISASVSILAQKVSQPNVED